MKKNTAITDISHPNQWTPETPQQKLCWELYVNPESETFSNALRSAIKAGFGRGHANQITTQKWWLEKARRLNLVSKAEKVLEEVIDLNHIVPAMGPFGPLVDKKTKLPYMRVSTSIVREKKDVAMFALERLGRDKGYGKTEQEDPTKVNRTQLNVLINVTQNILNTNEKPVQKKRHAKSGSEPLQELLR